LERNNWNRQATARDLGIHKTTLFRKIKRLDIKLPKRDGRMPAKSDSQLSNH
jgi:DNA-binding NtrC family response regulator